MYNLLTIPKTISKHARLGKKITSEAVLQIKVKFEPDTMKFEWRTFLKITLVYENN